MLPSLGELFGVTFYTYPLMMGLAWGFAYQVGSQVMRNFFSVPQWNLFFWGIFLFAWLGSKLLFLWTVPELNLVGASSFWLGGGFVFYGGLLSALLFVFFYVFLRKDFSWESLAYLVPILLFSHAIGRVGCFLAGCCYGAEILHTGHHHPVQLYEAISLFLLSYILNRTLRQQRKEVLVLALYFVVYGFLRFGLEFFRGDEIRGHWGALSTSQWISLILLLLGVIFASIYMRRKRHGI